MEEQPASAPKKKLHISPSVQALIIDIPEAVALLERLKTEEGYEVQDIADYGEDKSGAIGHIVVTDNDTTTTAPDYVINSAEGIVQVLTKILSPANSNAPHSPPASSPPAREPAAPGYQAGGGGAAPDLLRMSGERSLDGEAEGVALELRGLQSESGFTRWCNWFSSCCRGDDEQRNPLLPSAPGSKPH